MALPQSPAARGAAEQSKLPVKSEQQLKICARADYISAQLLLTNDVQARASFESELAYLREQYRNLLPDNVVVARVERLQELRRSINLKTVDNRAVYSRQVTRAVNALCGGGV